MTAPRKPAHTFRYSMSFGLAGCYMPDSTSGPYIGHTRRELVDMVRSELASYELPAALLREVSVARLWGIIKRHGSSAAHFHLYHRANVLSFHGLTEEEADAMERENGE